MLFHLLASIKEIMRNSLQAHNYICQLTYIVYYCGSMNEWKNTLVFLVAGLRLHQPPNFFVTLQSFVIEDNAVD